MSTTINALRPRSFFTQDVEEQASTFRGVHGSQGYRFSHLQGAVCHTARLQNIEGQTRRGPRPEPLLNHAEWTGAAR